MKATSAALGLLIISIAPAAWSAPLGELVKITITGDGLTTPIEITTPGIEEFTVGAGPGVFVDGVEQTEGFIIDWSKGVVTQLPAGLRHYEVWFYSGCAPGTWGCRSSEPSIYYVVAYDFDRSREQGYVYLPGKDDERFTLKHQLWRGHGLEGNWFRATRSWESLARPLIATARATDPSP